MTDPVDYELLHAQLVALTKDEPDALANSANFVALLYGGLPNINPFPTREDSSSRKGSESGAVQNHGR